MRWFYMRSKWPWTRLFYLGVQRDSLRIPGNHSEVEEEKQHLFGGMGSFRTQTQLFIHVKAGSSESKRDERGGGKTVEFTSMRDWLNCCQQRVILECTLVVSHQVLPASLSWKLHLCQLLTTELSVAELKSRLWQLWAMKCCFPESQPNIPPCFEALNRNNNFSNSEALQRAEDEEKWWLVFWECQLSHWLYILLSSVLFSLFALTVLAHTSETLHGLNIPLCPVLWQSCPRIMHKLHFHPLSF